MAAPTPAEGPLVVGYDGEEWSKRALAEGIEEAKRRGTSVIVVVVAGVPLQVVNSLEPGVMDIGYVQPIPDEGPIEIQSILGGARQILEEAGVDGEVEWTLGDPAAELLRIATEKQAGAIVVGTHHHSALGRLLGTDTAAELVSRAPCEVIVAH
jgi:nucleotide-binding universal stress UspA family protein